MKLNVQRQRSPTYHHVHQTHYLLRIIRKSLFLNQNLKLDQHHNYNNNINLVYINQDTKKQEFI
jgi:hypothetical protein